MVSDDEDRPFGSDLEVDQLKSFNKLGMDKMVEEFLYNQEEIMSETHAARLSKIMDLCD